MSEKEHFIRKVCTELFGKGDGTILGGEVTDRGFIMKIYDRTRELGKERAAKKYSKMLKVLADEKNDVEALNKVFDLLLGDKNRTTKAYYREISVRLLTLILEIRYEHSLQRSFIIGLELADKLPDYLQEFLDSKA